MSTAIRVPRPRPRPPDFPLVMQLPDGTQAVLQEACVDLYRHKPLFYCHNLLGTL